MVSVKEVLENDGILNVNRYVTPVVEKFDIEKEKKEFKRRN